MENNQRLWLEKERAMDFTGFPMKLCMATPEGPPGKWYDFDEWDWAKHPRVEFRTIGNNEILLDFDMDDPMELFMTASLQVERLKKLEIPFYPYDSGGKGYHLQIWLDCQRNLDLDWRAVRNKVVRLITKDFLYRTQKTSPNGKPYWHWNIDPRKWNFDDGGMGSVVRTVGGKKKKIKIMVDKIEPPGERKRVTRQIFPESSFKFETWYLPDSILQESEKIERVEEFHSEDLLKNVELPLCIQNLIEQEESGIHLNHMQRLSIVAYLWKTWKSENPTERMGQHEVDEIKKIFSGDPDYKENITLYQIKNIINALEHAPYKVPRCKFLQGEGIVDTEFCELCKMMKLR